MKCSRERDGSIRALSLSHIFALLNIINFALFSVCFVRLFCSRCSRLNKINFRFVCEFMCKCYCYCATLRLGSSYFVFAMVPALSSSSNSNRNSNNTNNTNNISMEYCFCDPFIFSAFRIAAFLFFIHEYIFQRSHKPFKWIFLEPRSHSIPKFKLDILHWMSLIFSISFSLGDGILINILYTQALYFSFVWF